MNPANLEPKKWYFVRRANGILVPYRLHQVLEQTGESGVEAAKVEMFVGSMIQTFSASQVVAPAEMPRSG